MKSRGLPLIFLAVGALLLLLCVGIATRTVLFLHHAAHATATITDQTRVEDTLNNRPQVTYKPTFTFQTPDGHWHVITSNVSTSGGHNSGSGWVSTTPKIHQQLPVVYDPSDPNNAKLDTYAQLWLAPTILAGLGALFTFFGVIFTVAGTNRIGGRMVV